MDAPQMTRRNFQPSDEDPEGSETSAPPPLPEHELCYLAVTVTCATELAQMGALASGYDYLRLGAERAQHLADRGVPWARALRHRYRVALAHYVHYYGVAGVSHPEPPA